VTAALQMSCVQELREDSENSESTEPCHQLLYEVPVCGDSHLRTQPSTASDRRTSASSERDIESSLRLSPTQSVENNITEVASCSQQSVLI